jgi:hypothetical protein
MHGSNAFGEKDNIEWRQVKPIRERYWFDELLGG